MSADFLKFLKNTGLLILLLVSLDQAVGFALEKLYFSLKRGQYAQTAYSINNAKEDIIILGSSRAVRHYSPEIISRGMGGLSCYNVGRDGQFIPYYAALEEVILARHKPKFIILDINVWELAPNNEKYEKLSALLPFVNFHPELKKYVEEISEWEDLKILCRTYLYNSTLFISLHDFLFAKRIPKDIMGYLPLEQSMTKFQYENYQVKKSLYDEKRSKLSIPLDHKAIDYYKKFLTRASEMKIKTFVIISPTILKEPLTTEKALIERIARSYQNVTFLDFSDNSTYNRQYMKFADEFHLNRSGSEQFSNELLTHLR